MTKAFGTRVIAKVKQVFDLGQTDENIALK